MRRNLCRLLAVTAIAAAPALVHAAAPAPVANAKTTSPMDAARKALDEVGDMNYQNKSLNEVINDLKGKSKLTVTVDPMVYQYGLDPNQPAVNVSAKQVKLREGLQKALAPFNLKCGLTKDGLYISTEGRLLAKQLRQNVSVDCDGTPFGAAAKQLAADHGVNLVVDPRLGDKATKAVTLKLDDVPLESAIRLMAEVADLGTVRMNNVLFITTQERAEKLAPSADGPVHNDNDQVFPFPAGPGGLPGGPPVIGFPGIGIAPGVGGVDLPAVVPEQQADPAPAPKPAPEKPAEEKPAPPPPAAPATPPPGK